MITRRVAEQRFLLTPSALVNQVMLYCVAVAVQRSGVEVHALTVLSNHWHSIVTDVLGRVPLFYGYVHEFATKCLNTARGRSEAMWSSEQTNLVELLDAEAILDKMVYTLANPVAAGLVAHGESWPGLRLAGPCRITVARPPVFFDEHGDMPAEVELQLTAPPIGELVGGAGDEAIAACVDAAVNARESELRDNAARAGRRFIGAKAIMRQRITARPPRRMKKARGRLVPRIACRNAFRRVAAVLRLRAFADAYAAARERWRAGDRLVRFPAGTYAMRYVHGARCAET